METVAEKIQFLETPQQHYDRLVQIYGDPELFGLDLKSLELRRAELLRRLNHRQKTAPLWLAITHTDDLMSDLKVRLNEGILEPDGSDET